MPPSESPLAHKDIEEALDRAIANGKGIRLFCPGGHGQAISLRQRAYKLREIDRRQNRRLFEPDHPMFGNSVYDALVFAPRQASDETWFLYIEVSTPKRLEELMEELE